MSVKNVSLKVIASQMKVSINTVSHSLRDLDDISEPLKQRIRKKAIELGYMPNHVAQKMRKDEKPLIAILIDSFVNLYFNTFSSALTKLFREKKTSTIFCSSAPTGSRWTSSSSAYCSGSISSSPISIRKRACTNSQN